MLTFVLLIPFLSPMGVYTGMLGSWPLKLYGVPHFLDETMESP